MVVADLDAVGRGLVEPADDLGGVGGVGHEQQVLVVAVVDDQVVDDAAGVLVAAQRVLRLARADLGQVVGQRRVDELGGAGPGDHGLAEVADVEDADRRADRGVLLDHATLAAGVLERHRPATELGELRAQRLVAVVERRPEQLVVVTHARKPIAARWLLFVGDDLCAAQRQPGQDQGRRGRRRRDHGIVEAAPGGRRRRGRGQGLRTQVGSAALLARGDRQGRRGREDPDLRRHRVAAADPGGPGRRPDHRRTYAAAPAPPPARRPTRHRSRWRCPPPRPSWSRR